MEHLPQELIEIVFSYLHGYSPLQKFRLVNRRFNQIATRQLFSSLDLVGSDYRYDQMSWYTGYTRFSELADVANRLLPVLPVVKTLKFIPEFYEEDYWKEREEMVHANFLEVSDGANNDDLVEETLAERERVEKTQSVIEIWKTRVEKQSTNMKQSRQAITTMIREMCDLECLVVSMWFFEEFGEFRGTESVQICSEFASKADFEPPCALNSFKMFTYISENLHAMERHIKELVLLRLDPSKIVISDHIIHTFIGLTSLTLQFEDNDALFYEPSVSNMPYSLFKASAPTLKKLDISFKEPGCNDFIIPNTNIRALTRIFSWTISDGIDQPSSLLVLPQLRHLIVQAITIDGPSLVALICRQPKLQALTTHHVFLNTVTYQWNEQFIQSLPLNIKEWTVANVQYHQNVRNPVAGYTLKHWTNSGSLKGWRHEKRDGWSLWYDSFTLRRDEKI